MTVNLTIDSSSSQRQITSVADRVLSAKRLLFVSGAGISCSAGIPDFRSLHGLYDTSQGDSVKGRDLFDVSLFSNAETTSQFYKFMAELKRKAQAACPTPTHRLLKTFRDRGSLLRAYTQNIDGLEARVGLNLNPLPIKTNNVVQLHGDVHTLKCTLCSDAFQYEDRYMTSLQHGIAVECPTCADKCAVRIALGRRAVAIGTLRPDIVLYGETHPSGDCIARTCNTDLKRKPDCLLIAGTSLKIPGLKRMIKDFSKAVHMQGGIVVLVNLTEVATKEWKDVIDFQILGSSDAFVEVLHKTRPAFFTTQVTLKACQRTKFVACKPPTTTSQKIAKSKPLVEAPGKDNVQDDTSTQQKALSRVSFEGKENIRPPKRKLACSIAEGKSMYKRRIVNEMPRAQMIEVL